jgi:hypothetical protein
METFNLGVHMSLLVSHELGTYNNNRRQMDFSPVF